MHMGVKIDNDGEDVKSSVVCVMMNSSLPPRALALTGLTNCLVVGPSFLANPQSIILLSASKSMSASSLVAWCVTLTDVRLRGAELDAVNWLTTVGLLAG